MRSEFYCQRCDGQSIVLPDDFIDEAHITCRNCGALQGTLRDLRHVVAENQKSPGGRSSFSGC